MSDTSGTTQAFVTLLTTPSYLPGVLVLLHSLHALHPAPRDFKIVCLVTPETVDAKTIGEVRKAGFDLVIGVEPIGSGAEGEAALGLMGRPDLNLALTKLHLFRLAPLFHTLIYLDADILPLRPLDHLFSSTEGHVLSACADTGWPDCFNSGVMVIRPRESDFEGMRALVKEASEGGDSGNGSFDGADQGLLNEWFSQEGGGGDWNRLSFTYNVTPSAAYQYAPAYKRYAHKISAVHFIGKNKPWSNILYRPAGVSGVAGKDEGRFDYSSLLDRWYSIYDTHVRPTSAHAPALSSTFTVPETLAIWNQSSPAHGIPQQPADRMDLDALKAASTFGFAGAGGGAYTSLPLEGRVDLLMPKPQPRTAKKVSFDLPSSAGKAAGRVDEETKGPGSPTIHHSPADISSPSSPSSAPPARSPSPPHGRSAAWDAQSHSPPKEGLPEMANAQIQYYQNAWDAPASSQSSYFSAPPPQQGVEPQYPTLPASVVNDSWYAQFTSGPAPDAGAVGAVFPWEGKGGRKIDRVFPRGSTPPPSSFGPGSGEAGRGHGSKPSVSVQLPTPPPAPSPPTTQPQSLSEAMASYRNAWDSDPSIVRYISKITGGQPASSSKDIELGLRSVPQTPRLSPEEMEERRLGHSEARSDGSGDGDDEDEGEDDDVLGKGALRKRGNPNPRYRDRQAQTDKPEMSDVAAQYPGTGRGDSPVVPKLGLGFAGGGLEVPGSKNGLGHTPSSSGGGGGGVVFPTTKPSVPSAQGGRKYSSSGSESTVTPLSSAPTPASAPSSASATASASAKPRRMGMPPPQPSSDRIPQRTTQRSPIVFTSSLPTGLSPTKGEFSVGGYGAGGVGVGQGTGEYPPRTQGSSLGPNRQRHSRTSSSEELSAGLSPLTSTHAIPGGGGGGGERQKASRTFDPSTDVDVRRRDTQEVLTRFMRAPAPLPAAGAGGGGAGGNGSAGSGGEGRERGIRGERG